MGQQFLGHHDVMALMGFGTRQDQFIGRGAEFAATS
jgi:hypothetical protein